MSSDVLGSTLVREHGVHRFESHDGVPVTSISAPTWEEFEAALSSLPETEGYIVSPELITSPSRLEDIHSMQDEIGRRQQRVAELSNNFPWGSIVLGTATFEPGSVYNSAVRYRQGSILGQYNKQHFATSQEGQIFSRASSETDVFDRDSHSLIICSDLILAGARAGRLFKSPNSNGSLPSLVEPGTKTLLVSSCWGTPLPGMSLDQLDEQAGRTLNRCAEALLNGVPGLEKIIVTDRAIPETGLAPFNAVFEKKPQ